VDLQREYPWLPCDLMHHYARTYGARIAQVIDSADSLVGLGRKFGPNFYEIEVRYLMAHEWAETAADILTRRTKHGLHMSAEETTAFSAWFDHLASKST
jgi:glycerol-3-phosphate dehydrogenase